MKSIRKQRGFIGDVISAAIGGASSFFGQSAANEANLSSAREVTAFNERQAALNRQQQRRGQFRSIDASRQFQHRAQRFVERLSNTAHQRQVRDLRKAGLNPILSARYGGSSTPSSPSPSVGGVGGSQASGVMPRVEDALTKGVSSALAARRVKNETKRLEQDLVNLEETEKNIRADTVHKDIDSKLKLAQEKESTAREIHVRKQAGLTNAQHNTEEFKALAEQEHIKNLQTARKEMETRTKMEEARIKMENTRIKQEEARMPGMLIEKEIDEGMFGKVTRALGRILGTGGGAASINPVVRSMRR